MNGPRTRRLLIALALVLTSAGASGMLAAGSATASPAPEHHTGTLPDGASWIADVPSDWNGTLLLYSHGYGPLNAADAPDPATKELSWAWGTRWRAPHMTPTAPGGRSAAPCATSSRRSRSSSRRSCRRRPRRCTRSAPRWAALISALEDQKSAGRLDGALTTCGIVAGANNLNQYQLDGEYALSELLAPGQHIQLTHFIDGPAQGFADSAASAGKLLAAAQAAQGHAPGPCPARTRQRVSQRLTVGRHHDPQHVRLRRPRTGPVRRLLHLRAI